MKNWSKIFAEETRRWIANRIIWAIVFLLIPIGLLVWHWGLHILETPKLLKTIQHSLFGVAPTSIIAALIVHYIGILKRLRAAEHNAYGLQFSLEKEREKNELTRYAPIYRTQTQPQKPTPKAFEVLKWFNTLREGQSADVTTVSVIFNINRDEALTHVQELHGDGLIDTVVPGPGEWNGRYAITTKGLSCVLEYAT